MNGASDMRIIGPPAQVRDRVLANVQARTGVHPRFINEMFPVLWDAGLRYGIDPVGVVAQSGKETAWGNFTGNVKPEFYNTAGIKIRHNALFPGTTDGDRPLAHQMFPNWAVGADAHVQHLRAYAGWPVDADILISDPRYVYVIGRHKVENWSELGGKWAPAPSYGPELEAIAKSLAA